MDFLVNYQTLLILITFFMIIVVLFPFVYKERKKKKESSKLINNMINVSSLTEHDINNIQTLHPEGKKMYTTINKSVCVGCGTCVISCKEKKVLYLINGKSTLIDPLSCKTRGDCERQCPTSALKLIEYGEKLKITVPDLDENFESNIKGIYVIGTLSGTGLIKEAINQGRIAVNHIMKDVFPDNLPDVIVIGAGPAGLSATLSSMKFGLNVRCIEKDLTANTIKNFPKNKILMAEPVEMPLFGPLWVGDTTKEELLIAWERILKKTNVKITTGSEMELIEQNDGKFIVFTPKRAYTCDKIILALGNRGIPRKLNIPGEDGKNVFYNLLDAEDYKNSIITIVGAGDSAVEAALSLFNKGCKVHLIVRGDGFPKVKSKNRDKINNTANEESMSVFYNSSLKEITDGSITVLTPDETVNLKNKYVFIMAGGQMPFDLLKKIGIRFIEKEV